jgi:SnoaL-like domain
VDGTQVAAWIDGYVRAWSSNDPGEIGALFTDDAAYYNEPYATPHRGRQAIVEDWLGRRDEPGQASFRWWPLAVTDELAVVQGETVYHQLRRTYSNLWVIRLAADGRCREFTEWWMRQPDRS